MKKTVREFFENELLLQPDVVFDSESNDCNLSFLAPPGKLNYNAVLFETLYIIFCFSGSVRRTDRKFEFGASRRNSGCFGRIY